MAIAVTTEPNRSCPSETGYGVPFATLEMSEAPDSPFGPIRAQSQSQTVVQAVEGVVYVIAGDDEWVLTPGDSANIPAGMPYRSRNAGDGEARWLEIYCAA
jgi:mannose-6-phosphate isomerase-like protein (cupin superfamily)